jgi:predicted RNase H-like HicB family nuclease
VELPGCHSQAPDLRTRETNTQEAIRAYLKTLGPDEHTRITVKIVDDRSIESLKVVEVE